VTLGGRAAAGLFALLLLALPSRALATYSLTAVDRVTRAVGGAGASCVPYEVDRIYEALPDRGALNAQAYFDEAAQREAALLLAQGLSAGDVVAAVTDPASFPLAPRMQWGVVDADGGLLAATGSEALSFAGDLTARSADGRFGATVQGNVLTSSAVLTSAAQRFASQGCDLIDRLMLALEAAGAGGEGDQRCTPEGRPANSAYLDLTLADGGGVHISVPDVSPADPIVELRARYDAYRAEHPCEAPASELSAPAQRSGGCSVVTTRADDRGAVWLLLLAMSWRRFVKRARRC
jgi:MYXO-CTERM domain-containing protein